MGLPPLEYIDCFLDSPNFREIISLYEKELEDNAHHVKALVRECKHMIQATEEFSKVQKSFANVLGNFTFQTIGEQTEDEKMITRSLETFSKLLLTVEDYRHSMVSTISVRLLQTLEKFRKEQIQKARDEKKRFDKSTHSYYDALQKHLTRKKDLSQVEADSMLEREHAGYRQSAFDYVCKLQDVHAQKQYELVEPIIGYVSDVSTFLHLAYDSVGSIRPELQGVQFKVQILRETHLNELEKAYQLKAQVIEEGEAGLVHHPDFLRQGNVFVQDNSKKFLNQWHRYFCQFRKKDIGGKKVRQIKFIPIGHQGNLPSQDFMEVRECIRARSDETDRRFCFDLDLISLHGTHKYTVQATSSENRKGWLEIMEGKEPVYSSLKVMELGQVNDNGIAFVQKCIDTIESRGLDEEGLYRKPGVVSKASKLVKECIEKGKTEQINLTDEFEWDTKTIASAVKYYLSKHLGEPLFTFTMHQQFIDAAKIPNHEKRLCAIRELYEQLPASHRKLVAIIIWHLSRVAAMSNVNLMKASNIAVCFGPTLMRPERESVATIVDIKYQNIIVEVMVDNVEEIFREGSSDSGSIKSSGSKSSPPNNPPPPLPSHISTKKTQELVDSGGYQVPVTVSTGTQPISRVTRGVSKPAPPPVPISRTASTISTASKGRSPSPEPYEVPLKMLEGDKRRPPPNPPGGTGGPPPPLPKSKPLIPDGKKRSFSATVPYPPESNHNKGHTPSRVEPFHVRKLSQTDSKSNESPPQAPARGHKKGKSARALYDCQAEDELELSFKKDEVLYNVTQSEEPDWLQASRKDGRQGLVPANYLELLQ